MVSVVENLHKPLVLEGFDEACGHGFVVATGIADVGENLGECLFVVNLTEVAVLLQVLLGLVVGVDVGTAVVVVGLAMNEALQGQAVGEGGSSAGQPTVRVATGITRRGSWRVSIICWG